MNKIDEMNEIVICKHCNKPEYYGEMRSLSGFYGCRECYKKKYEKVYNSPYDWDDLDERRRPTMEEYIEQERRKI